MKIAIIPTRRQNYSSSNTDGGLQTEILKWIRTDRDECRGRKQLKNSESHKNMKQIQQS
jgi:hypothetical protein